MYSWSNKVAVVTGANQGIGLAIFKALAKKGVIVICLDKNIDTIQDLCRSFSETAFAIKCDLTKENEVHETFEWIEEKLGGIDIIVNNAAFGLYASFHDTSIDDWNKTFDVNVIALTRCTKEALKTMRKRGDNGYIFYINSVLGHEILEDPRFISYTASKHAVTVIANCLRKELSELKSNIKVTNLCPNWVATPMASAVAKELFKQTNRTIKGPTIENVLEPEDVAETITSIINLGLRVQVDEIMIRKVGSSH